MCVSRMHESPYCNDFDEIQYRKRIKYAANNGVNTMILTGTGEALQNKKFLQKFHQVLCKENHPFPNVELQTTGVMLMDYEMVVDEKSGHEYRDYYNIRLLKELGVNTISLSVSDLFDSDNNWDIIGSPEKYRPSLVELCQFIKVHFNLRISLNMTDVYNDKTPKEIIQGCSFLGADQITFRELYHSNDRSKETKWVKANAADPKVMDNIHYYIVGKNRRGRTQIHLPEAHGKPLYRLPFGPMAYSVMGMSTVMDDNCMSKNETDKLKYVILRENGKLYCQWDDEGSLIF